MQRKTLLYLFVGICAFVAAYLYYVDVDRKKSIEKYFTQPAVNDVYKLKSDNEAGSSWLVYYKVVDILGDRLVFYRSKMAADASVDIILNHYDTKSPITFYRKVLQEIRDGKWNNYLRDNMVLVEIIRR